MTPVRRILGIPLTLLVAVVVQVAIVNRMPLPGGAAPDLVLLAVCALGSMLGRMTGMVAGFCGGLLLDIAPPAGHLAGEYALVFCLAGYACGRMRDLVDPMEEHANVMTVTVMAVGAVGGEAVKVALGLMLSAPDMTGPAVRHVLPGAILYDLILAPFVLTVTALAVSKPARPHARGSHHMAPRTAAQYGAVRTAGAGSAPKLRLSGGPTALAAKSTARPVPRLRLGGSVSPALSRTDHRSSSGPLSLRTFGGGGRPVSLNFSSGSGWSGLIGGRPLGPSLFAPSPLRGAAGLGRGAGGLGGLGGGAGGLGKGWLKNSPSAGSAPARGLTRGLSGGGPGRGWLKAGPLVTKKSAVSSPGKGWLKGSGTAVRRGSRPRVSSPGKGWLRPARPVKPARRHSPGRGWLKGSGTLARRTTYQSRATPSFRRRRGIRLGGRK